MQEAKLFMNGGSQAVRLPKEFRFEGDSVYISRCGNGALIQPKNTKTDWSDLFAACGQFSDDFMADRDQGLPQERDWEGMFDDKNA